MVILIVIFATSLLGVLWAAILLVRNNMVFNYRKELISSLFEFDDWQWRRDVFMSVGYQEMVFKFWRRLDSFYPDKSFINERKI